jgi:hypothetical protein
MNPEHHGACETANRMPYPLPPSHGSFHRQKIIC